MTDPIPFVPDRFRHAAAHYLTGRAAYSPRLIRRVALAAGLDGTQRLLDLGCGPGQLSIAFASWVAGGLALDPEPEMLRIASELGAGIAPNIAFRNGSSYDLGDDTGRFRLAVIGRAFHWMDRADTLRRLDALIEPGGAVALFGTSQPESATEPWMAEYQRLLDQYAQADPARARRRSDDWVGHEAMLMQSAFASIERISVVERRRVPVDALMMRPLSMSSLSRSHLGERLDELMSRLKQVLDAHARDGWLDEWVESTAVIARR
ncbi:class I SAM-dependent methyltransferase [Paraburkholderia sp. SARCC-3016]|uniref:class I SAM-dependent methyltransferase n=1 Tax=Paraburkholderia sp. SARCC-3016 TaxID=3058611 RepID=UPI002808AC72|nr:class I SAM-dependent methyltransferase [Paraburkholderia sp. SARCC-3016]MDQ7976451.1 class I SAM-dependent methyltransferase [Paraburkholderia sp. SARCC-3016]